MSTDCNYCGAYVSGGLSNCPACGKRVKGATGQPRSSWDRSTEYATDFSRYSQESYEGDSYSGGNAAYQEAPRQQSQSFANETATSFQSFSDSLKDFMNRQGAAQNPRQGYNSEEKADLKQSFQEFVDEQRRTAQRPNTGSRYECKPIYYLCYLGILSIIPYFLDQRDGFAKFHSNQGLALFIILVATSITGILAPVGVVFFIYGLVQGMKSVHNGVMKPLPLIEKIQILK